jgi:hypothetical protein
MLSNASLIKKDGIELAILIYSLCSGNAGVSEWKIGDFLLGFDWLKVFESVCSDWGKP